MLMSPCWRATASGEAHGETAIGSVMPLLLRNMQLQCAVWSPVRVYGNPAVRVS
jgi:hypothetical protein